MRTLIFDVLKQICIIQDQFSCETAFQQTLVKNNIVKSSQLKIP